MAMGALAELQVLVIDCQSTAATPALGRLLEVGWAWARAGGSEDPVQAALIAQPPDAHLPRAVQRVTGITQADLLHAVDEGAVWQRLANTLPAARPVPTVIHYASFEQRWLEAFFHSHAPQDTFPFDIRCTHAIAARLLPDLPRRSLRALAGYFGFPLESVRRASGHVAATRCVWRHLVALLADAGVSSWDELGAWLVRAPSPVAGRRGKGRRYPLERDKRRALPDAPGVYRLKRGTGDVLYVGKAISLRRRVASYFRPGVRHGERLLEMLSQARDIDVTVTESALEAALLEADEIKRLAPPYNIALRDEQRRCWFASRDVTRVEPQRDDDHALGPLPSRGALAHLVVLARILPLDPQAIDLAAARAALGIPVLHRLEAANFARGFELFRQRVGLHPGASACSPRDLLALASGLWRQRLRSGPPAPLDEASQDDDAPWEPERVASELERALLLAAHLVRRGRWLAMLAECSIAWRTKGGDRRFVVLEGGHVVARGFLRPGEALPLPPASERPLRQRQAAMNIADYDRLRILTTELRRMTSESPDGLALRFGRRPPLFGERLWRVLCWV
jgi:DNA polymerase-3 subunit epsilon